MILRRLTANLKAQNWVAIAIELGIVVLGVFIGTLVANRNQDRLEQRKAERMLVELSGGLANFVDFFGSAGRYYAITGAYADAAFAGWRGDPAISDEQFVVAAYQASQIVSMGTDAGNLVEIYGANQLVNIDDPELRRSLANLMTLNFDMVDMPAVDTPYRREVRMVIPEDIQAAIRERCGDRDVPGKAFASSLPATCSVAFPAARWSAAAAGLRERPDLVGHLRWHRAAIAAFLSNMRLFERETTIAVARIKAKAPAIR